jgi:hypothetical protein
VLKGIELEGTGLPILELKKITGIKVRDAKGSGRIYLEEMMPLGNWRLTYTEHTIPDIKKLTALRLVREPEEKLTVQELAERVDIEAAQEALRGLKSKVSSLGFAAPEVFMVHMADIAELMNALATALVMQEVEDRLPPTPVPGDGEPLSEE